MCDLIVSVPDHCLFFYFSSFGSLDHFDHHVVVRNATLEFFRKKKQKNKKKHTSTWVI